MSIIVCAEKNICSVNAKHTTTLKVAILNNYNQAFSKIMLSLRSHCILK